MRRERKTTWLIRQIQEDLLIKYPGNCSFANALNYDWRKKGKTYYISIRVRKKVKGIDYYTTFGVAKKIKITK